MIYDPAQVKQNRAFLRVYYNTSASSACAWRWPSATNSSVFSCVASSTTSGAKPACRASSQRAAHRHQRSPSCSPPKPYSGRGVDRSLPTARENCRNSSVTMMQTVCTPRSDASVSQQPLRVRPVSGSKEQGCNSPPSTRSEEHTSELQSL